MKPVILIAATVVLALLIFPSLVSSNSPEYAQANLTLTAAIIQNGTGDVTVNLEDFEKNNPITVQPHGLPVRFFRVSAQNISYESISISAAYCEMDLNGIDERKLTFFIYENSTWIMLPTDVNEEENILNASANSPSLFAATSHSENTSEHIHNDTAQAGKSHEYKDMGDETISASFVGREKAEFTLEMNSNNIPDSSPPGSPVKFFSISASNFSYSGVNIKVAYNDAEFAEANESDLSIIHYTDSAWITLPTDFDEKENTLRSYVDSLSLFAISSLSGTGSMGMGVISNCLRCHGTNSKALGEEMMGGNFSKINQDIMSQSIHANINNSSSNLNRACWACHLNSTTPPKKHPMHKPALTCASCHVNSTEKFKSPLVTEHTLQPASIAVIATCQLCHGKSQMINFNGSTVNSTISHYGKKRTDMLDSNKTSTICSYCHQDPASEFSDVFNKTSRTNITHNGNISCSSCHGTGRLHDTTLVNMKGYNLSNCVQCHGKSGFAINKLDENAINKSIHANLNNASSILNGACWTCHSNIITAPENHPDIVKQPETCSTCHIEDTLNLTQKLKPNHLTRHTAESSQVKAAAACILCHSNDVPASGKTINSTVSHYAKYPTVDTKDCVSCHQNKEIGKKWSSPPDPRETVRLANVEKKLVSDEIWKLDQNYSIAISEADKEGQSAWIELYYNAKPVKKELVTQGDSFKYDTKLVEDGANKTIIDLGISDIFYGGTVSLVTFRGFVPKHIHTETSSVQCYTCHVRDYRSDRPDGYRYLVLKNEEQNITLNRLDIDFSASDKKTMYSGESWDLGSGYELNIKDFGPDRAYVLLALEKDGIVVKEEFVREGDYFTYNTTSNGVEITMLSMKIAGMFVNG